VDVNPILKSMARGIGLGYFERGWGNVGCADLRPGKFFGQRYRDAP
jgi:hypothetical protein